MKKAILLFTFILVSFVLFAQNQVLSSENQPQKVDITLKNKTNIQESISSTQVISLAKLNNPQRSRGIPASPYPYTKMQPDGTSIELMMRGDGVVHWEETSDGYTVLRNELGYYVYAAKDKFNSLVATNIIVSNIDNRTSDELSFLAGVSKYITYSQEQIDSRIANYYSDETSSKNSVKSFPTTGSRKLVAILVEFPDLSFTRTQAEFDDHFNGANYTLEGATGSVKQYYSDNSFTQLDLSTDVVGPYTLPNNMAYYGGNDGGGDDLRPQEMIEDALALANPDVDFSDYDNDGDGYVDGVYIVFAGYSEASGGPADAIWPHRWAIWPAPTYDGVDIYDYACSNELYGNSGTWITGIGTVCHEFGHSCGLPDYYDTDYAGSGGEAFTLGDWDVMDGGTYNNYGMTPPFFNSYSRDILNWQTPVVLNSPTSVVLNNTAENNESYYFTTQTSNEYYLVENRQQISWDAYIPHHGMLVYHVDQDYINANGNDFNTDPSFQGFDLVEADNTQTEGSRDGDPFPGTSNNTSFTDATSPSAESYASQNTNKPVTNIQEVSQVIYFDFMGGAVSAVPVADFVADQTSVLVGSTVNFTDLSTGVPDDYIWTFGGGTPGSSTDADPSIVYDTPGTYSVTLNVSNVHGTDEITKTDYITVTSAPIVCEFIDNIEDTENIYYYTSAGGYLTGVNDYNFPEFAEYYDSHTNNLVTGAEIGVARAEDLSGGGIITMKIWDVAAGKPGAELYTEDFDIADFTPSSYNEITFATPTTVPNEFFIGYEIYFTTPQDTFAIYQCEDRIGTPFESSPVTAYIKYSGTWRDIDDLYGGFNSSFTIAPEICPAPPVAEFSADITSGCGSLEVQFTDESSANTDTWYWDFGDGSFSTDQSPSHNYENPGAYTVELTATNTMGDDVMTKTDYIVVGATPGGVVVSGGGTQCGGSMILTASGGSGGTIYWQNTTSNGTSTANASTSESVSASGTYYFRAQSAEGCWGTEASKTVTINTVPSSVTVVGGGTQCGGVITLEANGGTGGTIYWQNTTSGGTSTANASDLEIVSTSGTYYFRSLSAEGCWGAEGSASVVINDIPAPVSVTCCGTQCGGAITITASGGTGGTIYWQGETSGGTSTANPTNTYDVSTSGTYYFRSQSAEGCWGDEGESTAVIYDVPADVVVSGGGIQCGGTMTLTATGGEGGTIYYQENISGGTQTLYESSSEEVSNSDTYYFRSVSAEGCWSNEGSADVTIHPELSVTMSSTDESAPGANDGSVTFEFIGGTPNYYYDFASLYSETTSATIQVFPGLVGGTYCVTVIDDNGCEVNDCETVNTLGAAPVANFSAGPTSGCDILTVEFTDLSSNNPISWAWTFGDGETSVEQDPYHIYNSPGIYSVSLEVTNATGSNSITMTDLIIVGETPTIDYIATPASGELAADGGIDLTITGGAEPYGVVWDHDAMETGLILVNLVPGDYYVTVTEDHGCPANEHIVVNWVNGILESEFGYSIYPNPTESYITIEFEDEKAENITIINVLGEVVYSTSSLDNKHVIDVASFAAGTYFVELQFNGFREVKKLVKQ